MDLSRNVGFPHLWSVEFGVPMCIVFLGKAKGPQWSHVDPCGASEVLPSLVEMATSVES